MQCRCFAGTIPETAENKPYGLKEVSKVLL
jgi:hypothetical protein